MQARIDEWKIVRNASRVVDTFQTLSPVDGSVVFEGPLASGAEVEQALAKAEGARRGWRDLELETRSKLVMDFVARAVAPTEDVAMELTMQIGRPVKDGAGEVGGWLDRATKMAELAPSALEDLALDGKPGFTRFIRREPLGVVLVLAPWNFPWLTAVNVIVPALLAGNPVVLKHSDQTPLVAQRMAEAAAVAGLPDGVFQVLHLDHDGVHRLISDPRVAFVAFTGSVEGGHAVQSAASGRFIGVGLELGGKDPAYVCADADLEATAVGLAEGVFYNAGQSCCGIERIYVHQSVFDPFVEAFVAEARALRLDDPRKRSTSLGPVVRKRNAEAIQAQIDAAVASGARMLIHSSEFPEAARGLPYLAPAVLIDVDHSMAIMSEETFGPTVGIMPASSDDDAVRLMNDSRYGLTASIWTPDLGRAQQIGDAVETGTWFMNRCDYLDPELAWVGVKDSGRGCSLSSLGYGQLTRPKSFHLRHAPA